MARLVVGELLADLRTWVGAGVVAGTAAAVGAVAACLLQTAAESDAMAAVALYPIAGVVVFFTAVATLVVLSSIAQLTISSQQRSHALWQLIGMNPRQMRVIVLTQLLLVALTGALIGTVLAAPLVLPFCRWVLVGSSGLQGLPLRFGAPAAATVVAVVTLVVTLGGRRAARAASRTSGMALVREADPPLAPMSRRRRVGAVVLAALVVLLVISVRDTPLEQVQVPLMLVGPLVAGVVITLSPLIYAPFLRTWTALVPSHVSASWFLAAHAAAHGTARTSATTSPLVMAVAFSGGLYAATNTVRAAVAVQTGQEPPAPPLQTAVLLIGGPLLLAAIGAAATVFMSGRVRDRESALVRAAGGSHGVVLLGAVWESVIYAVTATVLGLVAVIVTAGVAAWATADAGGFTTPAFGAGAVAATAGAGLLLLLAATVPTTLLALRRDLAPALSVD
ncbi:FtsX-like permease family protein [Kineococcus radiotolerans]|nr:FtsX-like permease family protein [Kineococcus radiotolerans]